MKELEALEKYFCNIVLAIKKPTVVIPTLGLSLTLKNDYIMIFLLLRSEERRVGKECRL